jgi:glutamate synthase domain-containing protein 2
MALPSGNFAYSELVREVFLSAARSTNSALYMNMEWYTNTDIGPFDKIILQLNTGVLLNDIPRIGVAMVELTLPEQTPGSMSFNANAMKSGFQTKVWKHSLTGSSNLRQTIAELRKQIDGIPIAVRIRTSNVLEKNLKLALCAGADVIVLEGLEHGGMLVPLVVGKGFGLPLPPSLIRAKAYLNQVDSKISLIAHGRFWEASDCLKALALGANAVILDTVLLYGMISGQMGKALPLFPIETLLQKGSKRANKLDLSKASGNLANLLAALREELAIGALLIGKDKLENVNSDDMYTSVSTCSK